MEYKNLLVEEQNHLRLQTIEDEKQTKDHLEVSPNNMKELANTAVKKSNSPNTNNDKKLQIQNNHNRNMTISQCKFESEQLPASPIKRFLFADKKENSSLQKSKVQKMGDIKIDTKFNLNKTVQNIQHKK